MTKSHQKKFFSDMDESLYPESWSLAGTKDASGNFFTSTYVLLAIGFLFLFVTILFDIGHYIPNNVHYMQYHDKFFFRSF